MKNRRLSLLWLAGTLLGACTAPGPPSVQVVGPTPEAWLRAAEAWIPRIERWRAARFASPVRLQRAAEPPSDEWGHYDAGAGVVSLFFPAAADPAEPVVAATLVHELVHALQDQQHGLAGFASSTTDAGRARLALVEGEAMLAADELVSVDLEGHRALAGQAEAGPLGTYTEGASFVKFLREQGGWEAVEAAWVRPPSSMVEVLAPSLYGSGLKTIGAAALGGGERMGAVHLRSLLSHGTVTQEEARALCLSWRGDALVREGTAGWRWTLALDAAADAERLASVALGALSEHPWVGADPPPRAQVAPDGRVVLSWTDAPGGRPTQPASGFPLRP